jgi:hypothetical protein
MDGLDIFAPPDFSKNEQKEETSEKQALKRKWQT